MSDYSNTYGGAAKDAANSIIPAADIDTQLEAVEVASATKADKVAGAVAGNLVELDSNGDMVDSGIASDRLIAGSIDATSGSGTDSRSGLAYAWTGAKCVVTHNVGNTNYTVVATHRDTSSDMSTCYIAAKNNNDFTLEIRAGMDEYSGSGGVAIGQGGDTFEFMIFVD